MHHIHKTEAIILAHKNTSEANRAFCIYTKDFGLIWATAQGIRKGASKLNAHLQDFGVVKIDLVRGRDIWRITNAKRESSLVFSSSSAQLKFAKRFSDLIIRLCKGEGEHVELFEHIGEIYSLLQNDVTKDLESFEIISILRTLNLLGYIPDHPIVSPFLSGPLSKEMFESISPHTNELIKTINQSLRETHL